MNLDNLQKKGYTIIANIYSPAEVSAITSIIDNADASRPAFRKTGDLFAIRQFLKELPSVHEAIFTPTLRRIIDECISPRHFLVKSIYFDKPEASNWFVAWHQDLTISVDKKLDLPGYGPWTVKQDQFAVQPPLSILERIFTIRIHLDDTDEGNGALRVIPGSHRHGIQRHHNIAAALTANLTPTSVPAPEETCRVPSGGIMIMRPLLQHASNRTTDMRRRRVIHIEFCDADLPEGLEWAEKQS